MNFSHQYLSIDSKVCHAHNRQQTSKNPKYERGYLGIYQR